MIDYNTLTPPQKNYVHDQYEWLKKHLFIFDESGDSDSNIYPPYSENSDSESDHDIDDTITETNPPTIIYTSSGQIQLDTSLNNYISSHMQYITSGSGNVSGGEIEFKNIGNTIPNNFLIDCDLIINTISFNNFDNITKIGDNFFEKTTISNYMFTVNSSKFKISSYLPNVTTIGDYFLSGTLYKTLDLSGSWRPAIIGDYAFSDMPNLTILDLSPLSDFRIHIGDYFCANNESLQTVYICLPTNSDETKYLNNRITFGKNAFKNCPNLGAIYCMFNEVSYFKQQLPEFENIITTPLIVSDPLTKV